MKGIKLFIASALIAGVATFWSCRDESLNPVPAWETAVHGEGAIGFNKDVSYQIVKKTKTKDGKDSSYVATEKKNWIDSMSLSDLTKTARFNHNWKSNDKLNTVTKVEFYVYWDEAYKDKDANDRVARHGGFIFEDPGKLLKSNSTPKASRDNVEYTVSLSEIYNLYKNAEFDYKDGKGKVKVIDGTVRTEAKPFTSKDAFFIRWVLTTADGRVFQEWNPDICGGTVPGLNCQLALPTKK
jgi:hypothetical protein